jgi:hypothetical protein
MDGCVRFQVLTAVSMMFRIVFWDVLPYIPEDNCEHVWVYFPFVQCLTEFLRYFFCLNSIGPPGEPPRTTGDPRTTV